MASKKEVKNEKQQSNPTKETPPIVSAAGKPSDSTTVSEVEYFKKQHATFICEVPRCVEPHHWVPTSRFQGLQARVLAKQIAGRADAADIVRERLLERMNHCFRVGDTASEHFELVAMLKLYKKIRKKSLKAALREVVQGDVTLKKLMTDVIATFNAYQEDVRRLAEASGHSYYVIAQVAQLPDLWRTLCVWLMHFAPMVQPATQWPPTLKEERDWTLANKLEIAFGSLVPPAVVVAGYEFQERVR